MRRWANAVLAALLVAATASAAEPAEGFAGFAGWPNGWANGWANTYRRFEKFIVAQNENVPASDLEIRPTGEILTSLTESTDRKRHITIVFYTEGSDILEVGIGGNLFGEGRARIFQPGTYAMCLWTFDELLGYQFRHALTWFQIGCDNASEEIATRTQNKLSVRMIEQPQPEENFWPNDRLLRFCDFQVFPRINPLRFFRENNKVSPNVTIAVTNAGAVEREKLDDSFEKLLHWRIYYNGRLAEKGFAAGDLHHVVTEGVGSYVVFVGVEGPDGFMPVSNFLQFPLFPERDGSVAVRPSATNGDGVPNFLLDTLAPDQVSRLRASQAWTATRVTYNKATIYDLDSIGPISDMKKLALISLWSAWAWSVDLARPGPPGEIDRIIMAPDTK